MARRDLSRRNAMDAANSLPVQEVRGLSAPNQAGARKPSSGNLDRKCISHKGLPRAARLDAGIRSATQPPRCRRVFVVILLLVFIAVPNCSCLLA